jgi:hypothetical protein
MNAAATTFIDAEQFFWFVEDNDPFTSGDQGLSTGVTHAWDYLSYHGILEVPGSYYIPKIAIIDIGFDLDPTTGVPLNGNLDYGTLAAPIQYDVVDHDFTAGGPGVDPDIFHGQSSFGVAAARPKNMFGSAGVGGHFVRPILIRASPDFYSIAYAIRSAVLGGADVISQYAHRLFGSPTDLRAWALPCGTPLRHDAPISAVGPIVPCDCRWVRRQ